MLQKCVYLFDFLLKSSIFVQMLWENIPEKPTIGNKLRCVIDNDTVVAMYNDNIVGEAPGNLTQMF